MKSERVYLQYILDAIASVEQFTAEGETAFRESDLLQAGVLYKLQTMAESTQHLSENTQSAHP